MDQATNQTLEKTPTGIPGFDDITNGGLPRGRTSLVVGGPGTGKTIFALQTLVHGARHEDEPGIFVAFEEPSGQIMTNAASFGWDLPNLARERLFFLDARLPEDTFTSGTFDLVGMLTGLEAKVADMGARRIVFDSIDVLLARMNDPMAIRHEIYRLHDWLSQTGLTGIVTSRLEADQLSGTINFGFVQYMADCLILLAHYMRERVSLRTLRLAKYRGSHFAENEAPLIIGPSGLEVASVGPLQLDYSVSGERVSSGIPRLDSMLQGGYYRGTGVLITGEPGTAKSTLCGAFAQAACERGEHTLYVSFDEAASEVVRNLASVNIHLAPHLESGLLRVASARAEAASAEEHYLNLKLWIDEHRPRCLVVDPLSAMLKSGGPVPALSVAQRLLYLTKERGVTMVSSSLLAEDSPLQEASPLGISTIADTWIHLSYLVQGGERNRELTIVKSRGTGHSNQVRELVLSDQGVDLRDVYIAGGEVLLGTLRWEKEMEEVRQRERQQVETERRVRELQLAEAETQARIEILRQELEARRAEIAQLQHDGETRQEDWEQWRSDVAELRGGDVPAAEDIPDQSGGSG